MKKSLGKTSLRVRDSFWHIFGKSLSLHGVAITGRTIYAYTATPVLYPPSQFKGYKVKIIVETDPVEEIRQEYAGAN